MRWCMKMIFWDNIKNDGSQTTFGNYDNMWLHMKTIKKIWDDIWKVYYEMVLVNDDILRQHKEAMILCVAVSQSWW